MKPSHRVSLSRSPTDRASRSLFRSLFPWLGLPLAFSFSAAIPTALAIPALLGPTLLHAAPQAAALSEKAKAEISDRILDETFATLARRLGIRLEAATPAARITELRLKIQAEYGDEASTVVGSNASVWRTRVANDPSTREATTEAAFAAAVRKLARASARSYLTDAKLNRGGIPDLVKFRAEQRKKLEQDPKASAEKVTYLMIARVYMDGIPSAWDPSEPASPERAKNKRESKKEELVRSPSEPAAATDEGAAAR